MNTEFNAFSRTGHVAYAYFGTNSGDKAEIYFSASTDGGTNWTTPRTVNTVWTNDQWMPVLAVKPDGTKLFMAWYDRRSDTNNGLMEVYGRWGTIDTNGAVGFEEEFRITPVSFPPVFSGTDTNRGRYDPTYPPDDAAGDPFDGVNLHWWYPEWPDEDDPFAFADGTHKSHVGEYNGVATDESYLYFSWTDNRIRSRLRMTRFQSDIRLIRLPWP